MRALFTRLLVPLSLFAMSAVSLAQDGGGDGDAAGGWGGGGGGGGAAAPEISPSLFIAGIVLLVGGALILVGRKRARQATS